MSYRFHCRNSPRQLSPKSAPFPANLGLPFGLQAIGSLVIKGRYPTNFNLPSLGGSNCIREKIIASPWICRRHTGVRHRNCGASLAHWFPEIFPMSIWNGAGSTKTLFKAPLTDRQSSGENDVQTRPVKRASND
ncbi:hypothetical protein [Bradyrhizobium sp. USDA 3315]